MMLDGFLAGTDALVALDAAHDAAWSAVDQELLTVCRNRMAMLLRHAPTLEAMTPDELDALGHWTTSDAFDERHRAALDFTEQYIVDVPSITDDQAAALHSHLGDPGMVDFVNALLVVEQRMTLELFAEALL